MAAWVYILYSASLDRFYIGSTSTSVEERLRKHLAKHRHFTQKAKDWVIFYREEFSNRVEAAQREREIKSWKSSVRIRRLLT